MGCLTAIPIQLDRLRHLKFDLRALAFAEREIARFWETKERVSIFTHFAGGVFGASDLAILLWAGLRHEDPALTLDGAFALLAAETLQQSSQILTQALREQLGMGEAAGAEGAAVDPPQPPTLPSSTGSHSGPSGGSTSA